MSSEPSDSPSCWCFLAKDISPSFCRWNLCMHRRTRSSQPGFMDARSRLVSRDVILPGQVKHLMLTEYCSVLDLNPTSGLEFQASSQQESAVWSIFESLQSSTYPTGCGQHHHILAQRWSRDALAVEPPPPVLPWRSCRVVKLSYAGITGLSLTGTLLATQMRHDWKSASLEKYGSKWLFTN